MGGKKDKPPKPPKAKPPKKPKKPKKNVEYVFVYVGMRWGGRPWG